MYSKRVCIYHTDGDGHAAGAIVGYRFNWDVKMIRYNYGWDFPWHEIDKDTEVFMVDVSLKNLDDMYSLQDWCGKLVWIDHEDIVDEYWLRCDTRGHIEGPMRSMNGLAACEQVWEYFNREIGAQLQPPPAIRLLGRYDMWDHKDPKVLPFHYGMSGFDSDPASNEGQAIWNALLGGVGSFKDSTENMILSVGNAIHGYVQEENRKKCSNAFMTNLGDLPIVAMNSVGNSLVFNSVVDKFSEAKAGCLFYYSKGAWVVNIYSLKDRMHPPLGKIATEFGNNKDYGGGGGGRAGAAGFRWHDTCLPFPVPITVLEVTNEQRS